MTDLKTRIEQAAAWADRLHMPTEIGDVLSEANVALAHLQSRLTAAEQARDAALDMSKDGAVLQNTELRAELAQMTHEAGQASLYGSLMADQAKELKAERDALKLTLDAIGVAPQFVADAALGATCRAMKEDIQHGAEGCDDPDCLGAQAVCQSLLAVLDADPRQET